MLAGEVAADWNANLPTFEAGTNVATRSASGKMINAIAAELPELFGGSADLGCSNKTFIDASLKV